MRLFVHLSHFNIQTHSNPLRPLHPYPNRKQYGYFLNTVAESSDALLLQLQQTFGFGEGEGVVRIVMGGNVGEKRVRLVKGLRLREYCSLLAESDTSIMQYQLEIEITRISGAEQAVQSCSVGQIQQEELFRLNQQLFQMLQHDDLFQFRNTLSVVLKYKPLGTARVLLALFNPETGYPLLHTAIYLNKNQHLAMLLGQFGQWVNTNSRSADGWLAFELALAIGNKKAMDLLLGNRNCGLNLNYPTKGEGMVYQLINSMNLAVIQHTIKQTPLHFQESGCGESNAYDYLWKHKRFTSSEKIELLGLMHQKHLQFLDYYRIDRILYASCRNYLPSASRRASPKKEAIYNPNLKIISGQLIKCRVPPHFSRAAFLSANCYIGALEEYDINTKLVLKNDREKLEEYDKTHHLSLQEIESVELMLAKDKSWYMKKEWFCFSVKEKRGARTVYACLHESTAHQWVSELRQAINAWNSLQHRENNTRVTKNYVKIVDAELQANAAKRISDRSYLDLFSKRLSLCEPMETLKSSKSLNADKEEQFAKSKSQYNKTATSTSMANQEVFPQSLRFGDFKMIMQLGQGSFGQVFLVQCLRNGKHYALKTFSKKKIILSKQTKFVIAQVNILKQIKHPFIITLHFTFQTPSYIYLGLEHCQGKDLAKHLSEEMTFPEEDVRIYAAEMVLALEYIHQLGVIYRDLKPENVMLNRDGHIMLVDFGLSKKTENNFAKTFCGSPAYLSPEMLEKQGVGRETDFFSLGVVVYELLFGEPPFYSDNIHLLYQNIQNGVFTFPRKTNEVTRDFIERLLRKQPKYRLGSGSINEIKSHAFFSGIDWQKLTRKEVAAPKRVLLQQLSDVESESELIGMLHEDFDYSEQNLKVNRFKNFSFIREDEFI